MLYKDWNLTKAAHKLNIHRRTIDHLRKSDEGFGVAFDEVMQFHIDNAEASNIQVARLPTREGYNDRNLLLSNRHPAYKKQPDQIQINTQVNMTSNGQVKSILSRILPNDDAWGRYIDAKDTT